MTSSQGSYLHHAVYGYFQNGGGACYVVRIGGNGAASPAARAELMATSGDGGGASATVGAFRVQALAEGAEGNDISVEVADSGTEGAADDDFKLVVKKGDQGRGDLRQPVDEDADGRTSSPSSTISRN